MNFGWEHSNCEQLPIIPKAKNSPTPHQGPSNLTPISVSVRHLTLHLPPVITKTETAPARGRAGAVFPAYAPAAVRRAPVHAKPISPRLKLIRFRDAASRSRLSSHPRASAGSWVVCSLLNVARQAPYRLMARLVAKNSRACKDRIWGLRRRNNAKVAAHLHH